MYSGASADGRVGKLKTYWTKPPGATAQLWGLIVASRSSDGFSTRYARGVTAAVGPDAIPQGRWVADLMLLPPVFGKEAIPLPRPVAAGQLDGQRLTSLVGHDVSGDIGGDDRIRSRTSMQTMRP